MTAAAKATKNYVVKINRFVLVFFCRNMLSSDFFSSSTEFRNCNMIHASLRDNNKFIKLEHIQGSQTAAHKIRLVLFIRGIGNFHILLSPVGQLNREKDPFYDFGELWVWRLFPECTNDAYLINGVSFSFASSNMHAQPTTTMIVTTTMKQWCTTVEQ